MMGMMWIWLFFLLIFGVACVVGLVWVVQMAARGGPPSSELRSASEAPMEILRRRYAGGEISAEQFDEMQRTLGQG